MMFLGIGIIRTEKCWPNSPTYSTDVGVLRGWGRAQIKSSFWVARQKRLRNTGLKLPIHTVVAGVDLGILWEFSYTDKQKNL